jgi:hypothetical protein
MSDRNNRKTHNLRNKFKFQEQERRRRAAIPKSSIHRRSDILAKALGVTVMISRKVGSHVAF